MRAGLYLAAAGVVWCAEGFLFSRYLEFAPWQTALMALIYLGLFAVACALTIRSLRGLGDDESSVATWRVVSLAPMLAAVVGSFASLPLLLLITILGKLF